MYFVLGQHHIVWFPRSSFWVIIYHMLLSYPSTIHTPSCWYSDRDILKQITLIRSIMSNHDPSWAIRSIMINQISHDQSWSTMINRDRPWSVMIHHDQSWSTMINRDPSWAIMIHHEPSWSCLSNHDPSRAIMIHQEQSWSTMINRDRAWSIVIEHDRAWWIMMDHDRAWWIMIVHEQSTMINHDQSWQAMLILLRCDNC